jgi:hypothetical protein
MHIYQILEIHKIVMTNLYDVAKVGRAAMNLFIPTDGYLVRRRRRSDVEGAPETRVIGSIDIS